MKRVAFNTLGCKVNQNETEAIKALFKKAEYTVVPFKEEADVYVINTCTVTHLGDRKSRQVIRKAIKNNPQAKVLVTGCYAQTSPGEILEISGVDLVIGTSERHKIVELVEQIEKGTEPLNAVSDIMEAREFENLPLPENSRTRAFLKVQEGCNQYCTYCIVPYARGPLRSRMPNLVVEQVKELVDKGFYEIVLSGTHTGAYGKDLEGGYNLAKLIEEITKLQGLKRLRISSVDPHDFTPELTEILVSSDIVCPHFHIPLQSGDDTILKRMKRPYNTDWFRNLIEKLKEKDSHVAFTTDVMVGFPGETPEQFENTMRFIREVGFADMHVFKYSPRKGTPAAEYPDQIQEPEKDSRSKALLQVATELRNNFATDFLNAKKEVLVERAWQKDEGNDYADSEMYWEGLTDNYIRVVFPKGEEPTGLVPVKLQKWQGQFMWGEPVSGR
ncbi:threonylcarbamoyladenosine tRNA methylthiotransferase MtaB [Desulfitispora alkaliphila]|uniref:tRNA (N(6)-L-threonylcarbamoyladenosine(37)-C(2))- methylthiotransferase MtaB n=1 Tax=Desulfitispora alkaliphila TaxID=622674 RepID=UPI003D255BE6